MANLSDMIEAFILNVLEEEEEVRLSRNELAKHFNVSPSQINYVLATRFGIVQGYVTESRRGGGGYITIYRLKEENQDLLSSLMRRIAEDPDFSQQAAEQIITRFLRDEIVSEEEANLMRVALSDNAIFAAYGNKNKARAVLFIEFMKYLIKKEDRQ